MIIWVARAGLVANSTSSGTPAASRRSESSHQFLGRYSRRSINVCPAGAAYAKYTATWAFSTRLAVPVYWRSTPTVAVPFLTSPDAASRTGKTATRHDREPHQNPHASVLRLRYEPRRPRLILLSSQAPNNAAVTAPTSADTPHATIYGCSTSVLRQKLAE